MNFRSFILTVVVAVILALIFEGGESSSKHRGPVVIKSPSVGVTIPPTAYKVVRHIQGLHPDPSPGDSLNASPGTWQNATSYTYQWQNCDSSGANCINISGAVSGSYTVAGGDIGHTIRILVTAHNSRGSTSAPSPVTAVVTAIPGNAPVDMTQPYFTPSTADSSGSCTAGCAIQGQQLQVTTGTWTNSPSSYSYQWQDCTTTPGISTGVHVASDFSSGHWMTLPTTGSCLNATGTGATTNTYTVGSSDVGKALSVLVTATNGSGSTPTTPSGSCNTGLMTTEMPATQDLAIPPSSTYFDNGQPGCSPISAVAGTGQFGTGTSGEHFCTNAPITCGLADIANTGPPVGTTFYNVPADCTSPSGPGAGCSNTGSGWSFVAAVPGRNPDLIFFTDGATLKNVIFHGNVDLSSVNNITVENNEVQWSGENSYIVGLGHVSNATIRNNDLYGLNSVTPGNGCGVGIRDTYGDSTGITFENNNIWFCGGGINPLVQGTNTIHDNYIHDFAFSSSDIVTPGQGDHFDGIQFEGNAGQNESPFPFYNNTLLMDAPQTSPIILSSDNNLANTNRQIVHNLVAGGDYCLYGGGNVTYPTTNSTFSRNIFSQIYVGDHNTGGYGCGTFGTVAYWTPTTNTWSSAYWDDDGTSITP